MQIATEFTLKALTLNLNEQWHLKVKVMQQKQLNNQTCLPDIYAYKLATVLYITRHYSRLSNHLGCQCSRGNIKHSR